VYVAFSMMDGAGTPYPNGMVFGHDATNVTSAVIGPFQTTQGITGSDGGGIWMGGSGLAFGPDGPAGQGQHNWIYLTTGNGTYDASSNWGDSFIKLDPASLAVPSSNGYFTPTDEEYRGDDLRCGPYGIGNDLDFGSGGVMLIPDNELEHTGWGYLSLSGEKEGYLWFIQREAPGGFAGSSTGCSTTSGGPDVQTYAVPSNPLMHNSPAFWEGAALHPGGGNYVYVSPLSSTVIYQFSLCGSSTASNPICGTSYLTATLAQGTNINSWGITPTISSASATDTDAILWAIEKTDVSCPESDVCTHVLPNGVFLAFDAVTMTQLYSSSGCSSGRDLINQATKNSVPTVANGYVYLGTQSSNNGQNNGQGTFYIFGPGATASCS
jgi:hypothetical protein